MDIHNMSETEYAEFKRQKIKEMGYTPKPKKKVIDTSKMSSEQIATLRRLGAKTYHGWRS